MSNILEQAKSFFDACETGKGWEDCSPYCHPEATFSAQAAALSGVETVEAYCEWMKNLFTPVPDGRYELKCFALDEERSCVAAFAVFHGTQTGPGGPGEPTGNTVAADYVYALQFDGDRIRHMTKVWNDTISLQQLGWA
ncbi:MAG: putative ester cyclase [Candidatus Latescibacterota bacterium]|jgi:predicted ester cyclase